MHAPHAKIQNRVLAVLALSCFAALNPCTPSLYASQVRETSRFNLFKPKTWLAKPAKGAEEVKKDFRHVGICSKVSGCVKS